MLILEPPSEHHGIKRGDRKEPLAFQLQSIKKGSENVSGSLPLRPCSPNITYECPSTNSQAILKHDSLRPSMDAMHNHVYQSIFSWPLISFWYSTSIYHHQMGNKRGVTQGGTHGNKTPSMNHSGPGSVWKKPPWERPCAKRFGWMTRLSPVAPHGVMVDPAPLRFRMIHGCSWWLLVMLHHCW